jgi:hypothetical protein
MSKSKPFNEVIMKYNTICGDITTCDECPIKKASYLQCKSFMVRKPKEFEKIVNDTFDDLYNKDKKKTISIGPFSIDIKNKSKGD